MAEGIGLTTDLLTVLKPASYGTVLGWYKADAESFADGAAVGTFTNQLGTFPNLTQATGANKPLFKLNAANGRPALLFDGTNDVLATASFSAEAQPLTFFIVAKRNTAGANLFLLDGIDASHRLAIRHVGASGKLEISGSAALETFDDIGDDWFVAQAVFNGASSSLWLNELAAASGTVGTGDLTGLTLGAAYVPSTFWNGYIAELICFDGTLSTDSAYTVRRALMAKYKIPYFDPSDIAGLRSKFMADALRLRDGEAVALWEDPISGYDLIQATSAQQPLLIRDELNHRSIVRFDGSNDFLRSASFTTINQPRTIIAVAKNNSAAAHHILFDGVAAPPQNQIYFEQTTGKLVISAGTELKSAGDVGTSWAIYSAIYNGASSFSYKNGTQVATGTANTQGLDAYTLGAGHSDAFPFLGDVYALLIYDGALSSIDRQRLEAWLKALTAL